MKEEQKELNLKHQSRIIKEFEKMSGVQLGAYDPLISLAFFLEKTVNQSLDQRYKEERIRLFVSILLSFIVGITLTLLVIK